MSIIVLRLGHRFARDKRLSTHVALTSRAFGADKIVFDVQDSDVKDSIEAVCESWGGGFQVEYIKNWKTFVKGFSGLKIHLTMYGLNLNGVLPEIRKLKGDKLIIIGGQKVPSEVYGMVDYNVAVGGQPHSEVAALAVFLDRLQDGVELDKDFKGRNRIIPQARGKKVVSDE
ncbi:MAG: tRNA (cytidine(56)-2'-O)-methyltransferase [Candidatus Altiarchaeota archaeon]|nr:tRNA (cytidine(56)-2'-O)-methyltransferase [Candidatus Altiarchaeota archaeon]